MDIADTLVSLTVVPKKVGERLKSRVDQLGLSQAEAARRCSLSPQRFNNYIAGRRPPDIETLVQLAKGLETSPDYLLGFNAAEVPDMAGIVRRLLELEGLSHDRACAIAETAQEAVRVLLSLPDDGDADLRSRIAAQAAWQLYAGSKRPQ